MNPSILSQARPDIILSGFLVCIPMLKEWQTEAGITVIDGWTFQVRTIRRNFFSLSHDLLWIPVFSSRPSAFNCLRIIHLSTLSSFQLRSHVYFKSQEMHGKSR